MALMRSTSSRPLSTAPRSSSDCSAEARPSAGPASPAGAPPPASPASPPARRHRPRGRLPPGVPAGQAAQGHLEVGLHDRERRAQLVRGVGDEALLGAVELTDGPQRAPRIPEPEAADGHDDEAVERDELPAHAVDRPRGDRALDLGLAAAGGAVGHVGDVGLTVRYMTTPETTTSATTIAVNSTTRRVVARAKTSGPPAGLTAGSPAGCSRRRAPS